MQLRWTLCVGAVLVACTTSPGIAVTSSTNGAGARFDPPSVDEPPSSAPAPQGEATSACPMDPPKAGAFCDSISTLCYYGPDLRDECREQYECNGQNVWVHTTPNCATDCPATHDGIPANTACPDTRVGCSYDEGTCACVDYGAGSVDAGADADADASVPARPGTWRCAPAPMLIGCPKKPPRGYDICVKPVTCDYGACELERALIWTCDGSTWERTASPCDP